MSKTCAKCQKTVYPVEELKCLDKTWHKSCFKCSDCGMTLNMKTYKGFDKMPYCEAHVPKAKATTVADTPEFKRISENTKIQSNAVYHADFEKTKGKFTQVTDDPELMRIKANTKIISNVTYHGDLEKKALMEQKRTLGGEGDEGVRNKNGVPPPRSPSSYMDELSSLPTSSHPSSGGGSHSNQNYNSPSHQSYNRSGSGSHQEDSYSHQSRQYSQQAQQQQMPPPAPVNNSSQHHHHRERERDPYQQQQQQHHQQQQQSAHHPPAGQYKQQQPTQQSQPQQQQYNSPYSARGQANVIYTSDGGPVNANSAKKVGSIADYDPMNNYYGSIEQQKAQQQAQALAAQQARMGPPAGYGHGGSGNSYQHQQSPGHMQQMQQKHHQQQPPPPQPQYSGVRYRALYDYEAQDVDELGFLEGDLIVDCTPIDEGWLTGTNLRSKARGMLPANYVQPA